MFTIVVILKKKVLKNLLYYSDFRANGIFEAAPSPDSVSYWCTCAAEPFWSPVWSCPQLCATSARLPSNTTCGDWVRSWLSQEPGTAAVSPDASSWGIRPSTFQVIVFHWSHRDLFCVVYLIWLSNMTVWLATQLRPKKQQQMFAMKPIKF